MGKKFVVRLTEQQLANLIAKNILGGEGDFLKGLMRGMKGGDEKSSTSSSSSDSSEKSSTTNDTMKPSSNTGGDFPTLDLNKPEDFRAYEQIADRFISSRSSNLLGIRGSMLADAAKNAQNKYGKYVPVELSLAQLAAEGGFSNDPKSRPIRTKNPYNVGNTDSGKNEFHSSVQSGIQRYYDLIAKDYLVGNKTASDLLNNFVNKNGLRYATSKYEGPVSQIANQVKNMGQPVYASLGKTKDTSTLA
jgi:hypothetical protein